MSYERELTTDLDDQTPDPPRGMQLHTRILIGLVIGTAAGLLANIALGEGNTGVDWTVHNITEPVGALFLRLLLMVVIPLVFSSLVVGVASIGDVRQLGRALQVVRLHVAIRRSRGHGLTLAKRFVRDRTIKRQ